MSELTSISEFISTIGFPIFVAVYMIIKNSKDTQTMNETLTELKSAINTLITMIGDK